MRPTTGRRHFLAATRPACESLPGPERGTYGELRAEGTRLARAPIVAFLEEHAIGLPGWLVAIEESLATGEYCGASGEVHPLNPGSGISDAVALMNYARWLPPLTERGPSSLVVGHNSAYRRDDLLAFGDAPRAAALVRSGPAVAARGTRSSFPHQPRDPPRAPQRNDDLGVSARATTSGTSASARNWASQDGWSTIAARAPGARDPLVGDPAHDRHRPHGAGTAAPADTSSAPAGGDRRPVHRGAGTRRRGLAWRSRSRTAILRTTSSIRIAAP